MTPAEARRGQGPLAGVSVVELGGIGPGPFACMLLADLGASVTRIERVSEVGSSSMNFRSHRVILRGRRSIALDLHDAQARAVALTLIEQADVLVEGFRPGVLERLGLAAEVLHARNPKLVIGRATGWGQSGPRAGEAGHDINYLALSGALAPTIDGAGRPMPALNMLGDFGAGGTMLAFGIVAALLDARTRGRGDVVDGGIVDGAALFTGMLHAMRAEGLWEHPPGENLFDGGAPFYGTYRTSDGSWIALGAIEPPFYRNLLRGLELEGELHVEDQHRSELWPSARRRVAQRIAERPRNVWMETFSGIDACVTPVLMPDELEEDPHLSARGSYVERYGVLHPAPAPRFGAHTLRPVENAAAPGNDTVAVLREAGLSDEAIDGMLRSGAAAQNTAASAADEKAGTTRAT